MKISLLTLMFLMPLLTLVFSIHLRSVSGECQSHQQSLLVQLNKSLSYDPTKSTKLLFWNLSTDCCDWPGVACNYMGHVIGLNLSNESISGGIERSELFSFQYLQNLDLSYNAFRTSIPASFANLTSLVSLNLSQAGFSGQVPIEISYLTRLVSLDLSFDTKSLRANVLRYYSFIIGRYRPLKLENPNLSTLVKNLSSLTQLYLDGVNISSSGIEWSKALSSSLPNLQELSMRYCSLSGPFHPSLENLQSLSVLRLSGNNFSDSVPEFLENFNNLIVLHLHDCGLKGRFPEQVLQVSTLEILDLSFNKELQGHLPNRFQNGSLKTLVLSDTNFSGKIPESIGALANLSTIDIASCNFMGSIPNSMTELTELVYLDFSSNNFIGQIPSFLQSRKIMHMDFSSNKLEGPIPTSVFNLTRLQVLLLSSNKFSGTIKLDWIWRLFYLDKLDLSFNNLTVDPSTSNSASPSFPQMIEIRLASCNLRAFPNLKHQSKLQNLDLSRNQISETIPRWIGRFSTHLEYLNLSWNFLSNVHESLSFPNVHVLDLQHNQLQGTIPSPPSSAAFVDYSHNNFTSSIPPDIGNLLSNYYFFSLSNNALVGVIPESICNASYLAVLDLSDNSLNGTIPSCLIERSKTFRVLNLGRNKFAGTIPDKFPTTCQLKTLVVNGNQLEGKVPQSLANCIMLEVLDLGNNRMDDSFPWFLKKMTNLRVLVLRNNRLFGNIERSKRNGTWPMVQILDISSNHFSGRLPIRLSGMSEAMKTSGNEMAGLVGFDVAEIDKGYYRDSVTVTSKGLEMELVKILTIFTSIDFSSNYFEGPIPEMIGELRGLYILNLSHNALTGGIPASLANLSRLESLDLSVNHLNGMIPEELVGLTFLSFLNLSSNLLRGSIPSGKQFNTFDNTSYIGNAGLCGLPLSKYCSNASGPDGTSHITPRSLGSGIKWKYLSIQLGYIFGFGIVVGPLMFWRRWRFWYFIQVDRLLLRIFPHLYDTIRRR